MIITYIIGYLVLCAAVALIAILEISLFALGVIVLSIICAIFIVASVIAQKARLTIFKPNGLVLHG
jgi:hypothetical protein